MKQIHWIAVLMVFGLGASGCSGCAGASHVDPNDAGVSADAGLDPESCMTDIEFFEQRVWPIVSTRCLGCHNAEGIASSTAMVYAAEGSEGWRQTNFAAISAVTEALLEGQPALLMKPTGRVPHTGGTLIGLGSAEYADLLVLTQRILDEVDDCGRPTGTVEPPTTEGCEELQPGRRMLRRLSHTEYTNTVRDLLGVEFNAQASFVADTVVHGFQNHPESLEVTPLLVMQYQQAAETLAEQIDVATLLPCDLADADIACGHRFIAGFGLRAFRRPLTPDEISAYRQLFALVVEQECFEQALRWVVVGMLQSPHFLYRMELGRRVDEGFVLTPYEVASELSYLLWQTMPDEALFERAREGQLLDPTAISQEVDRMVADGRSSTMVSNFVGRWLELKRLMMVVRDSEIYEALYFETREAMLQESQFFLSELWQGDRPLGELFTAQHSWLNPELAAYYGVPLGAGETNEHGFSRVEMGPTRPAGILTQGAFLTTHALPTSSSPIHRGVIVRERVLCDHLSPPPDGLDIQPPPFDPDRSTRERFAAHTDNPDCFGCHRLIDGIGFGFENYDGIGRYRSEEGGSAIDASGEVVLTEGDDVAFDGMAELAAFFGQSSQVQDCYARQWLRFGLGETEGLNADCYVQALSQDFIAGGGGLTGAVRALTRTPHFLKRTGGVEEQDAVGVIFTTDQVGVPVAGDDPATPPVDLAAVACGVPPIAGGGDGPQLNAPGLDVTSREDRWDSGYCAYYTMINTSDAPLEWAVEIAVGGTVSSSWNCVRSGDIDRVVFSGVDWNQTLAPMQQADFGFCVAL